VPEWSGRVGRHFREHHGEPIPTRAEALRAAKTLSRYTRGEDDPFLQQLDSSLVKFGQRTRTLEMKNMRATKITSYFVQ